MIVLLIIFLIFAIILYLPVSVEVKYIGGEFSYKLKYAFITFYPKKDKKPKKSKKKKGSKSKKDKIFNKNSNEEKSIKSSKPEKIEQDISKQDIPKKEITSNDSDINALDTLSLALDIFKAIKKKLGKFITSIKITDLYINFQVADLDAYDCALKFGKLNAILGNVLGFLYWNFKVKKKSISVKPKYNSNDNVYDISFKVKLGLGKGLGKILVMIFKVIPVLKNNDII